MPDLAPHDTFEIVRERALPSLGAHVAEYRHRRTGAEHLHISRDSDENVFLVALRTVPRDSTGVAHILEHTALCGSRRFPVRDPFFMMLRRSLNTFMNAITASDWTAYPFSTLNRKDFDNLLAVYLDAVFFPRLDRLDFAQEGHRLEFAERDDSDSPLRYEGVVYNEMKGAMSAPGAQLYQRLTERLFPTTTYHHNSGGDPARIPSLRHEQLVAFHRRHYHPSNAIFATCGDVPARERQRRFEELALGAFAAPAGAATIPDERRYAQPKRVLARYPAPDGAEASAKTHIVLCWLLGKSADLEGQLHAQLFSNLLLDNSASPMRHALETTELGSAISPLSGLEDSCREMFFACGIEGSEPEHADALESLALEVLERVAADGVPDEDIQAILHQIELEQREVGGDHYPYGLQLIMNCLGAAVHRGDAIAQLDKDAALDQLRARTRDPDFVPGMARQLLENPHRLRLTMAPDPRLSERSRKAEARRLERVRAALDEQGKRKIVELAQALRRRQLAPDDPDILPRLTLEDIPDQRPDPRARIDARDQLIAHSYAQGTNGLVYQHMVVELPALSDDELALLAIYTQALTEVGCAGADYLKTQKRQALHCGHVSCSHHLAAAVDDVQRVSARLVLQGNALRRNADALDALLHDSLRAPRFDELPRLRELVAHMRARADHGITDRGHRLAMTAAASGMSPLARWRHRVGGLLGIRALRRLDDSLDDPARRAELAECLSSLHQKILSAPLRALLIGEAKALAPWRATMRARWRRESPPEQLPFRCEPVRGVARQYWQTETTVNFCARSWPSVPAAHADAPALSVLAQFLRNGYLHPKVREQGGAYGAGAIQNGATAAFTCFSYRDPRLLETLDAFDHAAKWTLGHPHDQRDVDEAILGVVGALDRPASPAGEASRHFYDQLNGHDAELRSRFRDGVLGTRLADLRRVAERYLASTERASAATLTGHDSAPAGECEDWERESL